MTNAQCCVIEGLNCSIGDLCLEMRAGFGNSGPGMFGRSYYFNARFCGVWPGIKIDDPILAIMGVAFYLQI